MRITAPHLRDLGVIDDIVPEPPGGAHSSHKETAGMLRPYLEKALNELLAVPPSRLPDMRFDKFRKMGVFDVA